jgi:hypothetical protein
MRARSRAWFSRPAVQSERAAEEGDERGRVGHLVTEQAVELVGEHPPVAAGASEPLGLRHRHLADAELGRAAQGARHPCEPLEEGRVRHRLGPDEVEDRRERAGRPLDRGEHERGHVGDGDGLQAVRAVTRPLDLALLHRGEGGSDEGVAGPDDEGGPEDDALQPRAEEDRLRRELREEVGIRAARAHAIAGDAEAGEVDDAGHAGVARVVQDALGVADVDGPVGLAAPLGPDLREVNDRTAPVERADEGLRVPPHELDRVATRVGHHLRGRLRADDAGHLPPRDRGVTHDVATREAVGPRDGEALHQALQRPGVSSGRPPPAAWAIGSEKAEEGRPSGSETDMAPSAGGVTRTARS